MAGYHTPTVVQQTISSADMTELERLLLTHIFESAPDCDGLHFFAETSPRNQFEAPIETIRAALAVSDGVPSETVAFVREQLKGAGDDDDSVDLYLSQTSFDVPVSRHRHALGDARSRHHRHVIHLHKHAAGRLRRHGRARHRRCDQGQERRGNSRRVFGRGRAWSARDRAGPWRPCPAAPC